MNMIQRRREARRKAAEAAGRIHMPADAPVPAPAKKAPKPRAKKAVPK